MFFLSGVVAFIIAFLVARAFRASPPPSIPTPPTPLRLQFSSSSKIKIPYAKIIGCTQIIPHESKEIQGPPHVVAYHKCRDTYREAFANGDVGAGRGLFTEDTAVGPMSVYDIIGAFVSFNISAARIVDTTIYEIFKPYMTESKVCIYSSTVSVTFDGCAVTTITAKVLCECVPEREGKGGKIDACMIPLKLLNLTIKEGEEERVVKHEVPLSSDGKTLSQMPDLCKLHPRSFAMGALVDLCNDRGWVLE
jgi:hypothetical protein